MKKVLLFCITLFICQLAQAKKVKFAVDMTGQVINTTGIHVSGDFQLAAGYTMDWSSNETVLTQEGSSNIYSIVVDIPAFRKYEYKFLNGDQFYEAEFVPIPSRVGYDFNDNRWLYVDSLENDTTFVGAIIFATNAPANLKLVRYYVNMSGETVSSNGVYLMTDFDNYSVSKNAMYSFIPSIYETILYTSNSEVQFAFVNDRLLSGKENIPTECNVNDYRNVQVNSDTLLNTFCFSSCQLCTNSITQEDVNELQIFPNPSSGTFTLASESKVGNLLMVYDLNGRKLLTKEIQSENELIDCSFLATGNYLVKVSNENQNLRIISISIQK